MKELIQILESVIPVSGLLIDSNRDKHTYIGHDELNAILAHLTRPYDTQVKRKVIIDADSVTFKVGPFNIGIIRL